MISRAILALAAAASLTACNPKPQQQAHQPLHPMLDGDWAMKSGRTNCASESLRFEKTRLLVTRKGELLPAFDVRSAQAERSAIEIVLAPSARIMAESRSRSKVKELENTEIILTLSVSGDSISMRDVQVRDPNRGLYAPTGSRRRDMAEMFDLRRCEVTSS